MRFKKNKKINSKYIENNAVQPGQGKYHLFLQSPLFKFLFVKKTC